MLPALELGLGAQEVLSVPGTGRVVGVYSKAVYLRLPGGLVALTTFDVPPGPIHARTSIPLTRLKAGDRVVLAGTLLQAGRVLLDLGGARLWQGEMPDAGRLTSGMEVALDLLQRLPGPALDSAVSERARAFLATGDLAGAASVLGGFGPGLTPAGDDCLAGILLIANTLWGHPATPELAALAEHVETNEISRAFLRWAARGQSIEPVHRFLEQATAGDAAGASAALDDLTRFGHSSGADLALGVRLGLEELRGQPNRGRGRHQGATRDARRPRRTPKATRPADDAEGGEGGDHLSLCPGYRSSGLGVKIEVGAGQERSDRRRLGPGQFGGGQRLLLVRAPDHEVPVAGPLGGDGHHKT